MDTTLHKILDSDGSQEDAANDTLHNGKHGPVVNSFEMDTNTSHQKDVLTTGDAISDTLHTDGSNDNIQEDVASDTHKVLDSGPVAKVLGYSYLKQTKKVKNSWNSYYNKKIHLKKHQHSSVQHFCFYCKICDFTHYKKIHLKRHKEAQQICKYASMQLD